MVGRITQQGDIQCARIAVLKRILCNYDAEESNFSYKYWDGVTKFFSNGSAKVVF
jgi:hypothetical protein